MNIEAWQKSNERSAYRGWRSMLIKTFRLPDGREQDYDIVENAAYVVVAAFTKNKDAILIRQFRPGPEQILSSFCEGYVDEGETPLQAAARELLEETGYRAGQLSYLRTIRTAYSTEERICVLATECEPAPATAGDDDEFLEVFTLPLADFRAMIQQDEAGFTSIDATYLAFQQLDW